MLKAAIYARKSTDDNDRNLENKSITRQVEHAKAYAALKGWTVNPEHIYVDDGISGADYQNRAGFLRMLNHLTEFDVLVMSEPSRLGRDMARNTTFIVDIVESDVKIFYYLTDEEEKAETPEQKVIVTLRSYASEVERLKASQRSRDALVKKARQGYNAGGIVYGYDNVPVYVTGISGEQVKSHTEYQINADQANILRRLFRMYADGHGHATIAKTLNGDPRYREKSYTYFDGKCPPSPRKGTGSWAPSSIRAMLYNERYAGKVPYGEYRSVWKKGRPARVKQDNYLLADRPDLRIISVELWQDVQARLKAVEKTYLKDTHGNRWGRRGSGTEAKYLLTGLGRCGCCGANMVLVGGCSGSPPKRRRIYYYGCSYHANRGLTVCDNDHRARKDETEHTVLNAIERSLLTPQAIDFVVDKAVALIKERHTRETGLSKQIESDIRKLQRRLNNFLQAIGDGKAPDTVLEEINKLEQLIQTKEVELSDLAVAVPDGASLRRIKQDLYASMGRFKDLMNSDVPRARQALSHLLKGPIEFLPAQEGGRKTYVLKGETKVGALLDQTYIAVASPRGFEPYASELIIPWTA